MNTFAHLHKRRALSSSSSFTHKSPPQHSLTTSLNQRSAGSTTALSASADSGNAPVAFDLSRLPLFAQRETNPANADVDLPRQNEAGAETPLAQRIRAAIATGGHPLEGRVQRRLEQGLGANLSAVRVHSDVNASTLARSVNALAFTTGRDIFFRSGMYHPDTRRGMSLLAHEATHTLQQAAGPVSGTPGAGGINISQPGDRFERAASSAARQIAAGQVAPMRAASVSRSATGGVPLTIQRAVGFEVELNVPISLYNPGMNDNLAANVRPQNDDWANARVPVPYKQVAYSLKRNKEEPSTIYTDAHLAVVPDIGNDFVSKQRMEIVTTPIDTTNAMNITAEIATLQAEMQTFYNHIQPNNPDTARFLLPNGAGSEQRAMVGIPTSADPMGVFLPASRAKVSFAGILQATAGVYTHKLVNLHTAVAEGNSGANPAYYAALQSPKNRNQTIATNAKMIANTVYTDTNAGTLRKFNAENAQAAEALMGFLTLVAAYLLGGEASRVESSNPKNITGLFSRSAFSRIRTDGLSTKGERWVYGNATLLTKNFATATKRKLDEPLYNDPGLENNTTTVKAFLLSAFTDTHGRDPFTENESKNLLGPENLGGPKPGAVLEFRQISGAGGNPAAWATKMEEVAQDIRQLNV
ncbi:MAG TPA: DUF4157 domain-containing protein [Ktedonobacteraceae bacterium]|nr:DUF4157 domain-containing protein [Ktedonobacteraceae bacterium]